MDPRFSSAVFLILSCWLWNAECRQYNQILKVSNGGQWGKWGERAMCSQRNAYGFSLKVQQPQGETKDDSSVTGIRLHCGENEVVESSSSEVGNWGKVVKCSTGYLTSFALKVEKYRGLADDTAVNNIKFTCNDKNVLKGSSTDWGTYGSWSKSCEVGTICGIKTKVEAFNTLVVFDNTGLNDVKFYCCG